MTKIKMARENMSVNEEYSSIKRELYETFVRNLVRLDYCQAWYFETKHYIVLQSYSTIVAAISKDTNQGYDFLRKVYGYTATSAKHISKFFKKFNPALIYTWRDME